LSNAIKFVQNRWKNNYTIIEKNDVVEVQIHNNGKGIKERFWTIFDKFYQSRNQNVKKPMEAV
jgi:signal transduction histidine kinase